MLKRQKYNGKQKDTRWDRIRKRYSNLNKVQNGLKTDVIKRFIEMDFIGKHQERIFIGDEEERLRYLNPVMVMDMRHQLFQRVPKVLPLTTKNVSQHQIKHCIAHNASIEEHLMKHELQKFRNELEKNYNRHKLIPKSHKEILKLDKSLSASTKTIEDFYSEPKSAVDEVQEMTKLQLLLVNNEQNDTIRSDEMKVLSEHHDEERKRTFNSNTNNCLSYLNKNYSNIKSNSMQAECKVKFLLFENISNLNTPSKCAGKLNTPQSSNPCCDNLAEKQRFTHKSFNNILLSFNSEELIYEIH